MTCASRPHWWAEPDALGKAHEIHTLQFRCQPYRRKTKRADAGDLHVDFEPLDSKGEVPLYAASVAKGSRPDFRRMNVGTALREQARLLFIDHRRSVVAHLPTSRGSVLARLLEPARREFERSNGVDGRSRKEGFRDAYVAAMDALRTDKLREVEATIAATTKRTLGFMGRRHAHLEVELGIADPANPFHALRIVCREGDLAMPAERQGLGVQSAIVVGIFEALRTIGGDFGSIVIEEPEMYLHPQAQRYFYRLLADLVDRGEAQVIYSTHSPVFADPVAFGAIRLARREPGGSTTVKLVEREEDEAYLATRRDSLKILTTFDTTRSEALFAARVLLVEGPADQVAARHVAGTMGVDLDGENLAIVACGGKASIPFFARFLRALAIPLTVLHDEDVYDESDAPPQLIADNKNNDRINRDIQAAVGDATRIFVVKPTLESALGVGRKATDKPLAVLRALQSSLDDDLPQPLRNAVAQLIDQGANQRPIGTKGT